ncbi:hypothetical protein ACJX0J_013528, partial [Zea mays]
YPHARPRYNSNSHETPLCRALDVFDGISQHVPTRSAALVARTSNPEGLKKIEQITVDSASVETNMVFFEVMDPRISPDKLCQVLEQHNFKLYKVRSVLFGQKGIPYLNTYDGRTMRYPDPLIKANDTIKIDLETNKIMDFIKLYLPFHGLHQCCSGSASDPSGHAVLRPTLSFVGVRYPLLSGPAASNPSPEVAFMPLRSEIPANAAPAQTPAPEPVGRLMVVLDLDETLVSAYESSSLPAICFFDCTAPVLYNVLLTLQDSVHKVFYAVVEAAAVRADNSHLG